MIGIAHWAVIAIVLIGIIAIAYVIIRQMGVNIPPFVTQILWIIILVVLGVVAINFLLSLL